MPTLFMRVQSEQEYLQLAADLMEFGLHQHNPYKRGPDWAKYSPVDTLTRLPIDALCYLGLTKWDDEEECEVELQVADRVEADYPAPAFEDYPVLVHWHWEDDQDRMGRVTMRYHYWYSEAKIPAAVQDGVSAVKQTYDLFMQHCGDGYAEWCDMTRERRSAPKCSVDDDAELRSGKGCLQCSRGARNQALRDKSVSE
jgi:hypothetical protein